jgi:uncharacterized YccA/Bax inhibitor family protein
MMRTANPALNDQVFEAIPYYDSSVKTMTIQGTVNRTAALLGLVVASASWTWYVFVSGGNFAPYLLGGTLGGLILALITIFKRTAAPVTAPLYAVAEGLVLGGVSALFEQQFPGIVFQAVFLTFGTLAALLIAYTSRLVRPSENFKLGVVAATGGICLFYFISILLSFFGISVPLLHSSGPLGIAFSVFIVIIAALNLVLDFDFIENAAAAGVPKYMEWYAAFGLLVTLVWLYLEILRLLAKLQNRR